MGDKTFLDIGAVTVAGATVAQLLPPIAAALSIVWLLLRIVEHLRWIYRGRPPLEKP